jgi:hypothetical protein
LYQINGKIAILVYYSLGFALYRMEKLKMIEREIGELINIDVDHMNMFDRDE